MLDQMNLVRSLSLKDRIMKKVMLVTGTSTGLGVAISVAAAKAGLTVYATMRKLAKRGQLDAALAEAGVSAHVLELDVETVESVNTAVANVLASEGRIDVLVNNAGVGFARTIEQATEADMQWVLNVNVMGVIRATKAVLPAMRAQGSGRVINISSVGGLVGQPFNEVYCASKFAVEGITESMATYITPAFGIYFTAIEPGGMQSEFAAGVMRNFAETGGMIEDAYLPILQRYIGNAQSRRDSDTYQTAEDVAKVVLDAATMANPPVRMRTSNWSENLTRFKTKADPDGTLQRDMVTHDMLGSA
jgi:NAD(P)-dependent dehydrogenase (short-subunit alcohol dehydrogenase family)